MVKVQPFAGGFACGNCKRTYILEAHAEPCCRCAKCGVVRIGIRGVCIECKDAETLEKAQEIEDTEEEVFLGDDLYENLEQLIENHSDEEIPEFIFPAEKIYHKVNMDSWLEHEEEEYMQGLECDAFNPFEKPYGLKELRAAVDAFNEANKDNFAYFLPDKTKKICVRKTKAWENRDTHGTT